MNIQTRFLLFAFFGFLLSAPAATHYVDANNANPVSPFTTWSTAATKIQDAVDAANDDDIVLVTNGTYNTGGRVVNGFGLTNRVVVAKRLTLQSVNGPSFTAIEGYQVPGITNGDSAVRCIYLTNNATLIGFTLLHGATRSTGDWWNEQCGGGAWCNDSSVLISNCVLTANSAGDSAGGVFLGSLANCTISSNSVPGTGGGSYQSLMRDCTVVGNFSASGGAGCGAFWWDTGSVTLNRCLIAGNTASNSAAGAYGGVLTDCILSNNVVINGAAQGGSGGADSATLNRCLLVGNSADYGGAAQSCYLYDCLITNNTATQYGGGVRSCTAINCTIVNNTAGAAGGGADSCELDNSIVYFNNASSNANFTLGSCTFNRSCTTPAPDSGVGNITADPFFANLPGGDLHLQSASPCINTGTNSYVTTATNDFEGKPRVIGLVVDMGAYEFPTPVAISANYTNVAVGFAVNFVSQVYAGNDSTFTIDFGDGIAVTNLATISHSWTAPGDYLVTLTAYSPEYPSGISTSVNIHVVTGIYYVSLDSATPTPPFASWNTAATNIQDAIDGVPQPSATILVSNGTYNVGGRTVNGYGLTNRVVVNKAVKLIGLNGPSVTTIQGYQSPTNIYGDDAIRCVYMTNGSSLIGFTIANGATRKAGDWFHEQDGGGVWCESTNVYFSNCVFTANAAWDAGGGIARGTLINCLLASNTTENVGGGTFGSMLSNCVVAANYAYYFGGGIYGDTWNDPSTLDYCLLKDNRSGYVGGGAYGGTLNHCLITNNVAADDYYHDGYGVGGGADDADLRNCVIVGNTAIGDNAYGGGADSCGTYNCLVYNNVSGAYGGGLSYCGGANCTIVGNSAQHAGGGLEGSEMQNCIIYYNTAPQGPNYNGSGCSSCDAMDYCVTTPLPGPGVGGGHDNTTDEPLLADLRHIAASSPCRGAGVAAYTVGADIDDEPWFSPPSRGCDEYHPGTITGTLNVSVQSSYTNATRNFPLHLTALIDGHATRSRWDLGDGTFITNHPFIAHAWTAAGDYTVTLTAYNEQFPAGITGTLVLHVSEPAVYYVDAGNPNPLPPYSSWATAATNIQDAIDAAPPLALILVTNGIYQTGARVVHGLSTNRVAITKPVMVQSVNGAYVTTISGSSTMRCVYLTNDAVLTGFTLAEGTTLLAAGDNLFDKSGGAAWCESGRAAMFNCIISGNHAKIDGGGVLGGTLHNCALLGNSADGIGGAANSSAMYNCTLTGNSAGDGGAVGYCTLWNSIAAYNTATGTHKDYFNSTFNQSCLMTAPADGAGNIITAPGLVDSFHLASDSPCRSAGNSADAIGTDIDGEPWATPPSIGCDEFHTGATGALSVTVQASYTNIAIGFPVTLQAQIDGHATSNVWDYADGTRTTNQLAVGHSWSLPGDYTVTITAYNDDNPAGVTGSIILHVSQGLYYVARNNATPAVPYDTWSTAATNIQDAVDAAFVGSTVLISDGVYDTGGTTAGGTSNRVAIVKQLTVQSVNGPNAVWIDGVQAARGVYVTNFARLVGVTVTNGNNGGIAGASTTFAIVSNCVVVANNGNGISQCTVYKTYIARNSAYSGAGAINCYLDHCFLTGNTSTGEYGGGGGAAGGILNSCIVSNNSCIGAQGGGGGASGARLNDCLIIGNSGKYSGGIDYSTIYNCTIVSNSVGGQSWSWGGGVGNSTMTNSIIYYNAGPSAPNIGYSSSAAYCCAPDAVAGPGNFTNAPIFANASANNFHLAANSPCINSGINLYATNLIDLDGSARIVGGAVDIGAYEYQSPASLLSYAWAQQYGLPTDGSADTLDSDADGMNNWQEWIAGTNPTNATSVLKLVCIPTNNSSAVTITWTGVSGKTYFIQTSPDLLAQPAFSTIQSNIAGQSGPMSYTDTNTITNRFYRVGVQ